jgi:hypothetical protein
MKDSVIFPHAYGIYILPSLNNSALPFVPLVKFLRLLLDSKLSRELHSRWFCVNCEWSLNILSFIWKVLGWRFDSVVLTLPVSDHL